MGLAIGALEVLAVRRPCDDPLLRFAMHIRTALAITDTAVTVHQDRLHALTRPGYVPAFYELDRIVNSAASLRVALAESGTYVQAIRRVVETRESASTADRGMAAHLSRAAVARSGLAPRAPGPGGPTSPFLQPSSGGRRPPRGRVAERSGEVLVAVGILGAGAHRAGQLLQRQLDVPSIRDPVLHHRVLVRPPVGLRPDAPLADGDHRDVAHGPRPPGGADLALQPSPVPMSARLLHPCSSFAPVRPLPQLGCDNPGRRSIPAPEILGVCP
ncbi:hypothetical protein OG259_37985 [Streptomyces sp. NBC_00250]|uniref:hypothetical protein n=1 Tax=Streptomyces sp. NBC_00250 TaxID=2903641 RepID=UPI002E2BC207|nr:hypothetical protein [Streptomyces sp. NBC_00250]